MSACRESKLPIENTTLLSSDEIKPYLKEIFASPFRPTLLTPNVTGLCKNKFIGDTGCRFYPYANDMDIKSYRQDFFALCETKAENSTTDSMNKIGLVVGSGYVLSLAPEIPADDILLLDIEPAVHFYLLTIRKIILETKESEDFKTTQTRIKKEIDDLNKRVKNANTIIHFTDNAFDNGNTEESQLDDLYFLASEERFKKCLIALKNKNLIPMTINLFDPVAMSQFGELIKKSHAEVTFFNFTNILDYVVSHEDYHGNFEKNLCALPLSPQCKFIFTAHREVFRHHDIKKSFACDGIDIFKMKLKLYVFLRETDAEQVKISYDFYAIRRREEDEQFTYSIAQALMVLPGGVGPSIGGLFGFFGKKRSLQRQSSSVAIKTLLDATENRFKTALDEDLNGKPTLAIGFK